MNFQRRWHAHTDRHSKPSESRRFAHTRKRKRGRSARHTDLASPKYPPLRGQQGVGGGGRPFLSAIFVAISITKDDHGATPNSSPVPTRPPRRRRLNDPSGITARSQTATSPGCRVWRQRATAARAALHIPYYSVSPCTMHHSGRYEPPEHIQSSEHVT